MVTNAQQRTKQLLLTAGQDEFAAHGIAGARVERIAAQAGVNKERIYAYFGSKEKLFDAVVAAAVDEVAAAVPITEAEDPADYVGRVYDFHRANPTLVRLFLWEALHYRENPLPNDEDRAQLYRTKVAALAKVLGVEASRDVAAVLLMLIGLAAWPNAVPQMVRLILDEPTDSDEFTLDMRAHLVDFTRQALPNAASTQCHVA